MTVVDSRVEHVTASFALGMPCAVSVALMIWAPGRVEAGTYVALVALVLGGAAVSINTWRAAQPTGSIGQLIHEMDSGRRDIRTKSLSLIVSMLVVSAAMTALLVRTWLS
jgi:hypothetical protein